MINAYVPTNTIYTNKDELIHDKEYNIYQAALKYDPTRGAKFSTYLGNETKWMCLNIYNKNKRHPEIATEEILLDLNQDFSKNEHEVSIKKELFSKIMELIKDYPDERIARIFNMRYIEGSKNKVMPWKQVSQHIDMSIQGCINIHDSTINKLKIKLKEI
jgi:DNA-directed RNA polymerase sigma subunit (sigma70/sigma32)|tara:strand:+ start:535 stop:1014 length:480 start_codon:yes stop_codon:yes gene_type:complete